MRLIYPTAIFYCITSAKISQAEIRKLWRFLQANTIENYPIYPNSYV